MRRKEKKNSTKRLCEASMFTNAFHKTFGVFNSCKYELIKSSGSQHIFIFSVHTQPSKMHQCLVVNFRSHTADLSLEVLLLILQRCCLVMHGARSCMITGSYMPSRFRKSLITAFHNNAINLRNPRILHSRMVSDAFN